MITQSFVYLVINLQGISIYKFLFACRPEDGIIPFSTGQFIQIPAISISQNTVHNQQNDICHILAYQVLEGIFFQLIGEQQIAGIAGIQLAV